MLSQGALAGEIRGNRSETSPLDSWIIYRITAPTSCTLSKVNENQVLIFGAIKDRLILVIFSVCLSEAINDQNVLES